MDNKQKLSCLALFLGAILACLLTILIIDFSLSSALDSVFPSSIYAVTNTTRQLVTNLKMGEMEKAYSLLDDPSQDSQAIKDIQVLMNDEAFIKYEDLYMCDSYVENKVMESLGVLYYNDTSVRFKVEFMQTDSKTWKIHSFVLQPEYGPGEFGGCQ